MIVRTDPDGLPIVEVTIDLSAAQLAASAQALRTVRDARYRAAEVSADDVVTLREVTSLVDELDDASGADATARIHMTVARLGILREALGQFAAGEHPEREGDAAARPVVFGLLDALEDLHADALAQALSS